MLRDRRGQQGVNLVGGRAVKNPVRHLLQGDAGTDNRKISGRVRNRQGPQRDAPGILTVFLPVGPAPQEPVPQAVLGQLQGDRAVGALLYGNNPGYAVSY